MIVDAHHHVWDPARGYGWLDAPELAAIRRPYTVDDLRPQLAAAGVARTVLVEAGRCDPAEVTEFLAVAAAHPEVAGVVGYLSLADPAAAEVLAGHLAGPHGRWLVGVRDQVQGQPDPDWLDRPEVRAGLRAVAAAGLPYDLVVRVDQLPACARVARTLPELTFVLDHLGKPRIADGAGGLARWRAAVAPLAACPNAVAKLSGLVTEADWAQWTIGDLRPFVAAALDLFGPDRLMFGSDWPVCLLAARSYRQVLDSLVECLDGLTGDERAAILAGTATRSYRLTRSRNSSARA